MNLYVFIFLLHILVCIGIVVLRKIGKLQADRIGIIVAFLIPVWGVVMLGLKYFSDKNSDRKANPIDMDSLSADSNTKKSTEDKMLEILYNVNRSIVVESDDMKNKVVPLEEALVVNDTETKRSLLIDVLYTDPSDYVSQLYDAKANGDTEVVHYAATALAEIQKEFDLKFQEIDKRRDENPEDTGIDKAYQHLLEDYISSGLLEGDSLTTQLRIYSDFLGKKLESPDLKGRFKTVRSKADADIRLLDVKELEKDVKYMMERWPERSDCYLYKLQCAILRKDPALIKKVIKEVYDKKIYLSKELSDAIKFWDNEALKKDEKVV